MHTDTPEIHTALSMTAQKAAQSERRPVFTMGGQRSNITWRTIHRVGTYKIGAWVGTPFSWGPLPLAMQPNGAWAARACVDQAVKQNP